MGGAATWVEKATGVVTGGDGAGVAETGVQTPGSVFTVEETGDTENEMGLKTQTRQNATFTRKKGERVEERSWWKCKKWRNC